MHFFRCLIVAHVLQQVTALRQQEMPSLCGDDLLRPIKSGGGFFIESECGEATRVTDQGRAMFRILCQHTLAKMAGVGDVAHAIRLSQ